MDGDGICGTLGDALSQSQWGFMGFFMHIKWGATSADLEFLHETRRREKENISSPRNVSASFPRRRKPHEIPTEGVWAFHGIASREGEEAAAGDDGVAGAGRMRGSRPRARPRAPLRRAPPATGRELRRARGLRLAGCGSGWR
jgi:hypothetical protein